MRSASPHFEISLQPKQDVLAQLVEHSKASWIGAGGGRGGAKTGGMDRIMLDRRMALPGTIGALVMRNYEQIKKYHIDQMLRDYPKLEDYYHASDHKLVIPMQSGPPSEIHFRHAETLADVERIFRSGSYYDIMVDQAEQFSQAELREMKQAVRWKGTLPGSTKFVLGFNMGGVGIGFLDNIFHLGKFGPNERASDFAFVHFFPWDNVEWVRAALAEDGLTEDDYYHAFTDVQRMEYCAMRSDYGRNLNAQDTPLRNRDWLGSWSALEGAFFGRVFDRDATVLKQEQIDALRKPWWNCWMSQDWGKGHYCTTQWHTRGVIPAKEVQDVLGWPVEKPVKAIITYREYIAGGAAMSDEGGNRELAEADIAREIVERTPKEERKVISDFYLSPDAFEMSVRRVGQSQIAEIIADILTPAGLPAPSKADNARVDGWSLMYNLLLATSRKAAKDDECLLLSEHVPELISSIPLLMRDPKNLDDVLKTDKTSAKLEQDCADTARYGYKSKVKPASIPKEAARRQALETQATPQDRYMENLRFEERWKRQNAPLKARPRFSRIARQRLKP